MPLLAVLYSQAQPVNLVPNGSFEERTECIYNDSNVLDAPPWFSLSLATPDVFHECATVNFDPCPFPETTYLDPWLFGIPTNGVGCQEVFQGEGYAGLFIFSNNPDSEQGYREYLGVKLISPLSAGQLYTVYLAISLAERATHSSSDIQILFSSDSLYYEQITPVALQPQLSFSTGNYFESYQDWMELGWNYQAVGNEAFMYIGNFGNNLISDTLEVFNSASNIGYYYPSSYYYIDDVKIYSNTLSANSIFGEESFQLFPNPFTSSIVVECSFVFSTIIISSLVGDIIYTGTEFSTSSTELDLAFLQNGLYILTIKTFEGQNFSQKIVKR